MSAEVTPTLPEHAARVLIRPVVDPELAEWDKVTQCWRRVYIEENILAGFKVNYIEIETKQIDNFYQSFEAELEPTINECFCVTSEEELAGLVSRWVIKLSDFHYFSQEGFPLAFDL